ncbi:lactonase family protein [Streptomyces sp. NPDC059477]|uniref:lactonase family protein n=1 Tax=Streptomyces sp. NPDC059477 TaxID=3346847 RepID=UPI0036944138
MADARDGWLGPVSGSLRNTGGGPHPRQDSSHPHAVTFDPSGRFLGTADLGIDKAEIFRLAGGGLRRVSEVSVPSGMGPRHIAFSHDARTPYVIGELDGNIASFAYDAATGTVGRALQTVPTAPADYTGGQGGAEIAVHPSGHFLYGSNRGPRTIAGYRINGSAEGLTPLGFATEGVRGPTSFAVDPRSGELTPTGNTTSVPAPGVIAFGAPN